MSALDEVAIIPGASADWLNERQLTDYRHERVQCLEWLLGLGKNPDRAEGYALATVQNRAYRIDQFYRWVWDEEDGYTTDVTIEHADEYLRVLATSEKSAINNDSALKALQSLFKWRHHRRGGKQWEPKIRFSTGDSSTNPRDYLTMDERRKIREASLEYGSVPAYGDVSPEERDRWKAYLAQRFEKPKYEVTPDDWDRANSWKIPSLVSASLDAGLRPIEVGRATTGWVDTENDVLRIPKEESSKNVDNWIVGLSERTSTILGRWLEARENHEVYDGSEALWLSRQGNPYGSATLRYLLHRLCEIAEISTEDRQMSWYAIRHSTGTYMTREEDLAAAQAQLRHKSVQTTMKYDQAPVEDRRDALNRMG